MQPYNPYWNQYPINYSPVASTQQRLVQMEQQYAQQNGMFPTQMSGIHQIGLNGRIVDDFNTITANDVPMDNMGAVFVKRDSSEIQIRTWGNDGLIRITSYKPILDSLGSKANIPTLVDEKSKFDLSDESTEVFMNKFDEVMNRLSKIEKSMAGKKVSRGAKSNADDVSANNE